MRLTCPVGTCRTDNDIEAEVCIRCGTPLHGYARLSTYPAHLFNLGLSAARAGQLARARDLFAALVYWCPLDMEARNALAMACYTLGDSAEARHHWELVLAQFPADPLATQGLTAFTNTVKPSETGPGVQYAKSRSKKKQESSKRRR